VQPGTLLVNTARGGVLDLDAAYEALQQGRLGGVGLDVYPVEPPDTSHPIFRHPNFVGSPHVSSHTTETLNEMGLVVAQGVMDALQGRKPQFMVNPQVWREPVQR
ncbi:MAG: hydroxyacid dehydrogenase, partial [Deinococcus sp.]|nr:hydroxyacid dehydrogenase [Deinococcus sp.]